MERRLWWVAAALAVAGCGRPAALAVEDAWVRLPAVAGRPAAAYFMLRGGAADATLIGAEAARAQRAELHETIPGGMRSVPSVALPAAASVAFAPGGKHVMLFGIDPRLAAGARTRLTLRFADGRTLGADARVVGPADPAP